MKKKHYILLSAFAILGLAAFGTSTALAQGWFAGDNATPEETATRQQAMFDKEASVLGVTVDEVKSAWAKGQTFEELATEKGISETDLQNRLTEERKLRMSEHLKTLVAQGVITQDQSDQRSKVMEERIANGQGLGRGMHQGIGSGEHQGKGMRLGLGL
jgi:hypothetical protein